MKKILFICNEGMSTSFLAKKVADYSDTQDEKLEIEAHPESSLDSIYSKYDLVMLAPQLSYLYKKVVERVDGGIKVGKLDPVSFGRMNVEDLYNSILKELNEDS